MLNISQHGKNLKIEQIKNEYGLVTAYESQQFLADSGLQQINPTFAYGYAFPKNKPAYKVIQEKYPGFSWEEDPETQNVKFINYPCFNGCTPALWDLVQGKVPQDWTWNANRDYANLSQIYNAPLGKEFAMLLASIGAKLPQEELGDLLVDWLYRVNRGESATIFACVCPDYSYQETGKAVPYEYTFNELGSGIGLVANRLLSILPKLYEFFRTGDIHMHFAIAIADYEADSKETLERIGVSYDEFITRLKSSQNALHQAVLAQVHNISLTAPLLKENIVESGKKIDWNNLLDQAQEKIMTNDFGWLGKDEDAPSIEMIFNSRLPLYKRWYGQEKSKEELMQVLISQGAEYSAETRVVYEKFPNPLILGADHIAMAPFMQVLVPNGIPVLYLKRIY